MNEHIANPEKSNPRVTNLLARGCHLWALMVLGCSSVPTPPPTPPPTPQEVEACDAFCEVRVSLGCDSHGGDAPGPDEVLGTADDVPCAQACKHHLSGDVYVSDRQCLDTATTCEQTEVCVFEGGVDP